VNRSLVANSESLGAYETLHIPSVSPPTNTICTDYDQYGMISSYVKAYRKRGIPIAGKMNGQALIIGDLI
jgi:hypothetical protein